MRSDTIAAHALYHGLVGLLFDGRQQPGLPLASPIIGPDIDLTPWWRLPFFPVSHSIIELRDMPVMREQCEI